MGGRGAGSAGMGGRGAGGIQNNNNNTTRIGTPSKIFIDIDGQTIKPNAKGTYNVSNMDLNLQQILSVVDKSGVVDMTKKTAGRLLDPPETVLEMSVKYKKSNGTVATFGIRTLNQNGKHVWGVGADSGKSSSKESAIRDAKKELKRVIRETW